MKLSDILGWIALVMVAVPLLVAMGFLIHEGMKGAPWPITAGVYSVVGGALLFAVALALDQ